MGIDGHHSDPDAGDGYPDGAHERGHGHPPSDSGPGGSLAAETRSREDYYESLISGKSSEAGAVRPWTTAKPAVERHEWQAALAEGSVDRVGPGVIDERAKKFSPTERRIAEYLASGGSAVVAVHEGYGVYGRTPDARVNAAAVEFKILDPGASDRTVKRFFGTPHGNRMDAVLIIGDDYSIDWKRGDD